VAAAPADLPSPLTSNILLASAKHSRPISSCTLALAKSPAGRSLSLAGLLPMDRVLADVKAVRANDDAAFNKGQDRLRNAI
jgi:hypothetical protein